MLLALLQTAAGFCASAVTLAQMFTGVLLCRAIQKKGTTKNVSPWSFLGGFVLSLLMLQQGRILEDYTSLIVNLIGLFLNTSYLICYYVYSSKPDKNRMISLLSKLLVFVLIAIGYSEIENREYVADRYGMIVTIVLIAFVAAPLMELPRVVETESAECLPYPVILSGFIVSTCWLVYGVLIWNSVLMVQNTITTILLGFQLSLFSVYPVKSAEVKQE